jgi:hypothetical protein
MVKREGWLGWDLLDTGKGINRMQKFHKRSLESHDSNHKILRSETLRVLRSNLTLSSRATVCCLPWPRSGHGSEASADMFTMRRAGLCPAGTSRVWIYLPGVLGIGLGSGAVGNVCDLSFNPILASLVTHMAVFRNFLVCQLFG